MQLFYSQCEGEQHYRGCVCVCVCVSRTHLIAEPTRGLQAARLAYTTEKESFSYIARHRQRASCFRDSSKGEIGSLWCLCACVRAFLVCVDGETDQHRVLVLPSPPSVSFCHRPHPVVSRPVLSPVLVSDGMTFGTNGQHSYAVTHGWCVGWMVSCPCTVRESDMLVLSDSMRPSVCLSVGASV